MSPRTLRKLLLIGIALALLGAPWLSATAQPILTIQPFTWNVVGLDSNNVNVGPSNFPVGARVCNTGSAAATNVVADFIWDSADPYLDLRAGSQDPIALSSLAAGECADFYFEVAVTRNAAAYNHAREYHIEVTSDQTGPLDTPMPRELFVEHLVSQNRNATTDVLLDGVSIPAGGSMALTVGNSYTIELIASTATNGYEQIETFINLPNTIFRIDAVSTTYSADGGTDPLAGEKLYADGCGWVNDPNAPTYRSCSAVGKYGGNVTVTYDVTIVAGGGTSQTLNTLIYDFSGSSYHYNSDFATSARVAIILDPSSVTLTKNFIPDPTNVGGVSTLTFTLTNPNGAPLSDVSFSDPLPTTPGAMVVASPPNASTTGCGTPVFAPVAGAGTLTFSDGVIAAGSTCTVKVNVTVPAAGIYTNTSDHLFIGSVDTGNFATDTLTVNSAPPPPACVAGLLMAQWTFATGFNIAAPAASTVNVASASASPGAGVNVYASTQDNTGGGSSESWGSNGAIATGTPLDTANDDYFEFAIDTTGYAELYLDFWAQRRSANGPEGLAVYYGTSATPPGTSAFNNANAIPSMNAWTHIGDGSTTIAFTSGLNPSGLTYFRIYGFNSGNTIPGSDLLLDDVTFTGCGTPNPPTISKDFSPDPVAVGATSTLTFTVTNPNSTVALSGVAFSDTLPSGLTVTSSSTAQCGGTLTATAPDGLSFVGGSLASGASCTISILITATTAGPHDNVSGFVSSAESGENTGGTGSASDSLTAVSPPSIAKQFAPNPILAGSVSTLTFTLTNPNPNHALDGVAFDDTFPAAMVVSSPTGASASGCGSPAYSPVAGAGAISFSGGTIAAGGTCTVAVDVTVPSAGSYPNTSSDVSFVINGATVTGNDASDTLTATSPNPGLALLKQVGPSAAGPWSSFLAVPVGGDVYYLFTVENIGDVPLTSPGVTDPDVSTAGCSWPASLPVASPSNEDHIATCVVGPITALVGTHPNTATAQGTYGGQDYTDTSTATYATTGLGLVKSAAESSFAAAGEVLNYSYFVTNTGAAPLAGPVTIDDDQSTDEACPAVDTVGDGDAFLDPGESLTCTATYTTQPTDVSAGQVTNVASASAGGVASNTDSTTVPYAGPTLTPSETLTPTVTATETTTPTVTTTTTETTTVTMTLTATVTPTLTATETQTPTSTSAAQITDPAVTKSGDPSTAAIGENVVFTLVVTNNGPGDAQNVVLTDVVPSFLDILSVDVAPAGPPVTILTNTVTIDFGTVTPADLYMVTITTIVNSSASPPGGTNTVSLVTSSNDSDPTNNADSTGITIVAPAVELPETGFAPGGVSRLPAQPVEMRYTNEGDLRLEIPALGLEAMVVGVPQVAGRWDVSWLSSEIGYLDGTAFPTWGGNSLLTGHVTLPSGLPGPFADLRTLRYGDQVLIHAWGLRHIFEIRQVTLVSPFDRQVMRHEDQPWLTLITCQGYDDREHTYRWRVVARAVLISVEEQVADGETSGALASR